ncbi:MAG: hypothetical protein L3J33_02955 [Rhodobacteraceae bacterium]|nr:hypothetical protein [Paracoccaceae bacterium]
MEIFFIYLLYFLFIVFMVWLVIFLPIQMASNRNRRPFVWVIISLVGSPILAILLLAVLGNAKPE